MTALVSDRERMLLFVKELDHSLVLIGKLQEGMRLTLTNLAQNFMWEKTPAEYKETLGRNTTFVKQTLMELSSSVSDHHLAIQEADVEKGGGNNLGNLPLPEKMWLNDPDFPVDAKAAHNAVVWEKKALRHTKYAHTMLSNELNKHFPQQSVAIENHLHLEPTNRVKRRRTIAASGRGPTYTPSNLTEFPRQRISDIHDSLAWMASWDPKMHIALYTTDRHGNAHRTLAQTSTHQHPHTQSRPQSVSQSQPPSPGKATTDAMGRRPSSLASGPAVSPAKATESDSRFGTPTPNQKRPIATSLSPRDNSAFLGLTATVAGVFRCAVQFTVLGRCGRSNADSTHDIDATSHAEDTSVNDYYVNAGRVCVTAVDEQVSVWHSSEHRVFRRMTDQANAAILYFTAHKPEAVLSSFLVWLHSYHNLFTAKCSRCDRHLCYDSEEFQYLPPVVRSFATENKKHIVYHRQCQYSSR